MSNLWRKISAVDPGTARRIKKKTPPGWAARAPPDGVFPKL